LIGHPKVLKNNARKEKALISKNLDNPQFSFFCYLQPRTCVSKTEWAQSWTG